MCGKDVPSESKKLTVQRHSVAPPVAVGPLNLPPFPACVLSEPEPEPFPVPLAGDGPTGPTISHPPSTQMSRARMPQTSAR